MKTLFPVDARSLRSGRHDGAHRSARLQSRLPPGKGLIFPSAISKKIDLTIRKPIAVPSTPLSVIEVPDRFFSFLVATISYNAATAFGLADRAKMQQEIAANERRAVGTNNAKARPQILVPVVSRFD